MQPPHRVWVIEATPFTGHMDYGGLPLLSPTFALGQLLGVVSHELYLAVDVSNRVTRRPGHARNQVKVSATCN